MWVCPRLHRGKPGTLVLPLLLLVLLLLLLLLLWLFPQYVGVCAIVQPCKPGTLLLLLLLLRPFPQGRLAPKCTGANRELCSSSSSSSFSGYFHTVGLP